MTTIVHSNASSTFNAAIPYAIGSLSLGTMGLVVCMSATGTAAIVMGVVLALLGSYAFIGVVTCGLVHTGDPEGFEANVGKFMMTAASAALADVIASVAKMVLLNLIFGERRR